MPKKKLNDAQFLAVNLLWQERQTLQSEIADLQTQIATRRVKLRRLSLKVIAHRFDVSTEVITRAIHFVPKQTKWRCVVMPNGKRSYRRVLRHPCSKCGSIMCGNWLHRGQRKITR
jgi:hypothetical protein